jgi:hypothetical protein
VIVEGNNAHEQACEEQKKRYLVRPGFSHGSFLTTTSRLRKCQGGCPLGIPAMDHTVLNDGVEGWQLIPR